MRGPGCLTSLPCPEKCVAGWGAFNFPRSSRRCSTPGLDSERNLGPFSSPFYLNDFQNGVSAKNFDVPTGPLCNSPSIFGKVSMYKYSLIRSGVIYALVLRSSRGLSLEKMQPCLELTPDLLALANWRLFERQLSLPAALIFEIDTCFRLNENSPSRNENNATCRANHSNQEANNSIKRNLHGERIAQNRFFFLLPLSSNFPYRENDEREEEYK